MAKKAAALQSFQKCEIQSLAIPATILEDVEIKDEGEFDTKGVDGREEVNSGVRHEENGKDNLMVNISRRPVTQSGAKDSSSSSREPSDRIELAESPGLA